MAHLNPKTELNNLLHHELRRPIQKSDVQYQVVKDPASDLYTATLTLHCVGGESYEGQPCASDKESTQSAAAIALEAQLIPHGGVMPAKQPAKKKAKTDTTSPFESPKVAPQPLRAAPKGAPKAKPAFPPAFQFQPSLAKGKGKGVIQNAPFKGKGKGLGKAAPSGKAAPAAGAGGVPSMQISPEGIPNWKTLLNTAIMKYLKRPIPKDALQFDVQHCAEGFQATLTVGCFDDGPTFIGEATDTNAKNAQQLACHECLKAYQAEFGLTDAQVGASGSALPPGAAMGDKGGVPASGADSPKCLLNGYVTKVVRRVIAKGEIGYETLPVIEGGYQCTVMLNCMPDEHAGQAFVGEVAASTKEAEQMAAAQAVEWILQVYHEAIMAPKPPKAKKLAA